MDGYSALQRRVALLQGNNLMGQPVSVTLGPLGRNVSSPPLPKGAPRILNDGATIAH